ncbi:MAG: Rrf2 family transcriptional regulator [Pseudomonadota bacterium]
MPVSRGGPVRLSTRSRYAARALGELVRQGGEDAPVMMRKLAERQQVSKRYLDNIFATLRVAGLIRTTRGAAGGYMLNRPAETITLLQVVEALDGDLDLVECVAPDFVCERKGRCAPYVVWCDASAALQDALRKVDLGTLAKMELQDCSEDG